MVLAVLADVKRMLGTTSSSDDTNMQAFLDTADAWIKQLTGGEWDGSGSTTHTFYNVRQGEVLRLPVADATVTDVTVYYSSYDPGVEFSFSLTPSQNYVVEDDGKIRLFFSRLSQPFEGAFATSIPSLYDKVTVTYTRTGTVPKPVRDAVALVAAAAYQQSKSESLGVSSESIGDYSYSRGSGSADGATLVIPDRARRWLRPYWRKLRAQVT